MKMVRVTWLDSIGIEGWKSPEDVQFFADEDNMRHESVGLLHSKTRAQVLIVQSRGFHERTYMGGVLKIPRRAIVKIEYLEAKEE